VLAGAVPHGFDDLRADAPAPVSPVQLPPLQVQPVEPPAAHPGQYGGGHG
jgi:hypothetical protein